MNKLHEELWKFARGDSLVEQFEQWVYDSPELETYLGTDLYWDLITLNFRNRRAVLDFQSRLEAWLYEKTPRECDCITWGNYQKIPLVFDTADLLESFSTLRKRTPWLTLVRCPICVTYWYVAVDTVDDDYYWRRLDEIDAEKIIKEDTWPASFDDNERFWP